MQQRRIRKDSKAASVALRRDIDILKDKVNRNSNSDKTLQNRYTQQSQLMKQANDAMEAIKEELEDYATVPEDELKEWKERKAAWEAVRNGQSQVIEDLQRTKEQNTAEHTAASETALSTRQKKERSEFRATKLATQHKRLISSTQNPEDKSPSAAHSRLASETTDHASAKAAERALVATRFKNDVDSMARELFEIRVRIDATNRQIKAFETAAEQAALLAQAQAQAQARAQARFESRPITPEGDLPGTNPAAAARNLSAKSGRYAAFAPPEALYQTSSPANGYGAHSHSHAHGGLYEPAPNGFGNGLGNGIGGAGAGAGKGAAGARARSTSVLSGNSVYEDFEDDLDFLPVPAKRRSGMGSVREAGE